MPGPPPKPAAVRRRDGNPGKRPIPEEPRIGKAVVVPEAFPPPASLPKAVADVWQEIVPDLVEIGLVRAIDATVLEAMCRAIARARQAEAIVDEQGIMIAGHRGWVIHPAYRVAERSWKLATKLAGEYGMTAVGRLKVGAAVLKQKSLADELRDALDGPVGQDELEIEAQLAEVLAEESAPASKPQKKRVGAKRKPAVKARKKAR